MLWWLGTGSTKNAPINAGVIINNACFNELVLSINNNKNVIIQPVPNIIKSVGLKKPSINIDFFEFAGIK